MGNYFLCGFLILFGVMHLVDTKIPGWVLGVTALAAALAILFGTGWGRKPQP